VKRRLGKPQQPGRFGLGVHVSIKHTEVGHRHQSGTWHR
jgi:hypothetical protein